MKTKLPYCSFAYTLLWAFFVCTGVINGQDCGCVNCPVDILDQSIVTATFRVNGAANNSLPNNSIQSVHLKFNHSFPSEIEMKLISPAGQAVTLIGPQGTFASAVFFGGFDVSFVTDINETDPDPGMNNIWNNEDLTGIQQYTGAYLPFSGSLLNFNTGTVNGDWLLEITDPIAFDFGTLEEFDIVFVDQEGIECCEADAGALDAAMLTACQGEEQLLLAVNPIHNNGAPTASIYGYTYIISENDTLISISENPDLRTFNPGAYNVYGFSFDLLDQAQIPSPNGSLTLTDFASNIEGNNPIICGDITDTFLEVVILDNALETFVSDTICNGESTIFGGEEIFAEGTYRDTINTLTSCDSIVQLDLVVGSGDTLALFENTCSPSLVGSDSLFLTNDLGCDSLVIVTTSLLPTDTVFVEMETCELSQDLRIDTLTISTPECDSVVITSFFYETPDTIYTLNKTCFPDAIGLDTSFVNQGSLCDDVEITETILYLIDTTFLNFTTCDENQVGEFIMNLPTDTCDRVEMSIFSFAASDTTFLSANNCNQELAGTDTLFLTNEFNCDSLVITTTSFVASDTIFIEAFSCDTSDVGVDTIFLTNQFICDSIIINSILLSASDTTFIVEQTCDLNQIDPSIEVFTTEDCDSLVITEFEFVEPDTTFIVAFACEESDPDTMLLQNFQGCDSLVITNFENGSLEPTFLEEYTCDPSMVGPQMDTLSGAFCDSIIITNFNLLPTSISNEIATVCSLEEAGLDTLILTSANGCDSLVVIENIFEELPITMNASFTCNEDALGLDTLILTSTLGCDSLVVTDFILAEADTVFAETNFTCNAQDVRTDTLVFPTSTCDSVVIMTIAFEPLDIIMLELGDCNLTMPTSDTMHLVSAMGCDSTVIVVTLPLAPSITNTNVPVSVPSEVRMDTLFLENAAGCDSLAITNYFLETEVPDTVFVDVPTCDINAEPDTINGVLGEVVIEVPIPIIMDTLFLESPICSESEIENDTTVFNSSLGCDSVVITTFLQLMPSITSINQSTCDETQSLSDTLFLANQFGCDSLIVTNYELVVLAPTLLSETTCDPDQELIETLMLTSEEGCDSLVMITYELVETDTFFTIVPACMNMPPDTIVVEGADCPTLEIIIFENQTSDTTIVDIEDCVGPFGVEIFQFTNALGCDSIVMQTTTEAMQNETLLVQSSCIDNQTNDTLFLTGQFCDSLVITNFIFTPIEPTILETFTCDANDVLPDTLILTSSLQCDSLVVFEKILMEVTPTELFSTTCDASEAGIFRDTLSSYLGCDSILVETIDLVEQQETYLQEFTCDETEVGLDTTIVNDGECPSLLIVETALQEQLEPIFIEESTCDQSLIDEVLTEVFIGENGCDSIVVTNFIFESLNLNLNISIASPICAGEANGAVNLDAQDGVEVLWLFDQQEGGVRNDLSAGDYQVQLRQNMCDTIIQIIVPPTPAILVNSEIDYILCSSSGGAIFSQATGGQGPYGYLWQDGSTDSVRLNLTNGTYILTVTDAMGCTSIDTSQILNVPGLEFVAVVEDVTCFGEDDGIIEVSLFSGTPPYIIEWEDGSDELIRTDLPPGTYAFAVTDANDCNIILNRIVREPLLLEVDLQTNNAGEFEAQVSGGTPPYVYAWNDGTTTPVIEEPILGFGYEVTVTDVNDCIAFRDEIFAQVSSSEIDAADVTLFPNPNRGTFQFSFDATLDLNKILIYNIYGQVVSSQINFLDDESVEIVLPPNQKGTFILDASFKQGKYLQKLMVF